MAFRVRWVISAPIRIRILSSPCHLPSRVSRAPISKYPVAMSNAFAMLDHSSKYRSPVQPETLLSTMKSSRPLESTVMTLPFAPHPAPRVALHLHQDLPATFRWRASRTSFPAARAARRDERCDAVLTACVGFRLEHTSGSNDPKRRNRASTLFALSRRGPARSDSPGGRGSGLRRPVRSLLRSLHRFSAFQVAGRRSVSLAFSAGRRLVALRELLLVVQETRRTATTGCLRSGFRRCRE